MPEFVARNDKARKLIESTIEEIFASSKTPTTTKEAVQIWQQILSKLESEKALHDILPPGAGLSSQLSLIRSIFSAKLNLKWKNIFLNIYTETENFLPKKLEILQFLETVGALLFFVLFEFIEQYDLLIQRVDKEGAGENVSRWLFHFPVSAFCRLYTVLTMLLFGFWTYCIVSTDCFLVFNEAIVSGFLITKTLYLLLLFFLRAAQF